MGWLWILAILLYLGIGVFLAELIVRRSNEDQDLYSFTLWFWPILLVLFLSILIVYIMPANLAKRIKAWRNRKNGSV